MLPTVLLESISAFAYGNTSSLLIMFTTERPQGDKNLNRGKAESCGQLTTVACHKNTMVNTLYCRCSHHCLLSQYITFFSKQRSREHCFQRIISWTLTTLIENLCVKEFCFQEFLLYLWPGITGLPIFILSVKSERELLKYSMFYRLISMNFNTPLKSFEILLTIIRLQVTVLQLKVSQPCDQQIFTNYGNKNLSTNSICYENLCMSFTLPSVIVNENSLLFPHL